MRISRTPAPSYRGTLLALVIPAVLPLLLAGCPAPEDRPKDVPRRRERAPRPPERSEASVARTGPGAVDGHRRVDDRRPLGLSADRFVAFADTEANVPGRPSFKVALDTRRELVIERRAARPAAYDGPPGVTLISVQETTRHPPASRTTPTRRDDYLAALQGQYRLAGYYGPPGVILAYSIEQFGASLHIRSLVGLNTRRRTIHVIGPRGLFQYGSVHGSGRYAVLVSTRLIVVDLIANKSYETAIEVDGDSASPWKGNQVGGGYDLSGRHLSFEWRGEKGGVLVVRSPEGKKGGSRRDVTIEPERLRRPVDREPR